MSYTSWSVVFGEQPSAAKWNILGANDASFNDGSGLGDATITPAKWTNPYCFRAYDSAGTSLVDGAATAVAFATEVYDHNNNFASSAYTAPVDGVYHFDFVWTMGTIATGVDMYAAIAINAAQYARGPRNAAISNGACGISADIPLTAGQVVTFQGFQDSAGNETTATGNNQTWCSGHLVHAT